jgi:hypothetical protein
MLRRSALAALAVLAALAAASAAASTSVEPARAARILALDPDHVSARDVSDALAPAPAPRVILLSGSVPLVTMEPFGRFLAAMGYPEASIRDPATGEWSYSSYRSASELAGIVAAHYERDAMMPMLIGHSQGGMVVLRTLWELAGAFGDAIAVRDPASGESEGRAEIVDPLDGRARPVVGLRVGYAAALATGKLPRLLLGQWTMLGRLRSVPDTVEEFTGFLIEWDPIAGTFPGAEGYAAAGSAGVRTVTLPSSYSHIGLPRVLELAADPVTRDWIDAYAPDRVAPLPTGVDTTNLLHAADIWYSVKKHWCIELQRLLRADVAHTSADEPPRGAQPPGGKRREAALGGDHPAKSAR